MFKIWYMNIAKEIKQYHKKWLQHIQRIDTNRLPKQALQYKPKGRRNIGRPRKRWRDQLHLEDQGTGNTPNHSGTWWWWWKYDILKSVSGQTKIAYLEYDKDSLSPSCMLYLFFKFTWMWQVLERILHAFTCFFLSNCFISRFLAQGHLFCYMEHQTVLALSSLRMKSLWPLRTVVAVYQLTWHIPEHPDLQLRNTTLITSSLAKLTLCLCLTEDHGVVRKSWMGVCSHILNLRNTQRWDIIFIPWLLYHCR